MIRWRTGLVLTLLLLIPLVSGKEDKDDDDDDRSEESNEEEEDDDEEDDEDDQDEDKKSLHGNARRVPPVLGSPKSLLSVSVQRPSHKQQQEQRKKVALECYVCAYKAETPLRACLDPTKFRVHTITCHSPEDRCFTSVISHGNTYDAVIRGCRSGCIGTPETTCCEASRCNNQAFAMPVAAPQTMKDLKDEKVKVRSSAPGHPSVWFFVTILLILQTVVKVTIV